MKPLSREIGLGMRCTRTVWKGGTDGHYRLNVKYRWRRWRKGQMERKLICGSQSWNLCDPRSGYLQPCRDIRWGASLGLHRHANFTLTAFARAHRDQWRFLDEDLQLPEVSVGINAPVWQRKTERRYSV